MIIVCNIKYTNIYKPDYTEILAIIEYIVNIIYRKYTNIRTYDVQRIESYYDSPNNIRSL